MRLSISSKALRMPACRSGRCPLIGQSVARTASAAMMWTRWRVDDGKLTFMALSREWDVRYVGHGVPFVCSAGHNGRG